MKRTLYIPILFFAGVASLVALKGNSTPGMCEYIAPPPEPVIVDEEGFTILPDVGSRLCPGSDTDYEFTRSTWVVEPYPSCAAGYKDIAITQCGGYVVPDDPDDPEHPEPIPDPIRVCAPCTFDDEPGEWWTDGSQG